MGYEYFEDLLDLTIGLEMKMSCISQTTRKMGEDKMEASISRKIDMKSARTYFPELSMNLVLCDDHLRYAILC